MHYAIIIRHHLRDEWCFFDGEIRDRDGIKRLLDKHTPYDAEVVEFSIEDLMSPVLATNLRRVTEDVVREAFEAGELDWDCDITERFCGSRPMTIREFRANRADASRHSGEAA